MISCNSHKSKLAYPDTHKEDVVDTYFGVEVRDPYRWLEDDRSEATARWVKAQNALTFDYLDKIPFREALRGRSFLTLSSGEQRLVLLARAFVKDPDLLILDEPFQGLDPMVRTRAKSVVEAFCRRENKTLLFVTHYPELLPATINRTLHLGR